MNQKQPDTFSRMKTLIYRRLFATIIIMAYVAPLISTLNFPPSKLPISAVSSATVEGCAGMRARYICDIDNPSMFHICLGNKRFTMICPGELHFSERTQTCDWPEVANCRRLSRFQQSEPAPLLGFYNSTVTLSEVDSPPYKVAYDFEGENPQDITLATLGYSDDIKIESEISSTRLPTPGYENKVKANVSARIQGHAKRRRGNWKYSKALDRNSPLSRWWNNPVVTPAIPLSTAAPKLVGSDTKHVAGFAQPFKARISPQTSSVLGLYMPEESKLSKVPSEDYVQRKPIENKVKPIPKSYRSSVRAPWYRANKSKVNAHSDFSPSRSFKTRTSRESRLKPRKPVVISPFSPFTRGPVETENRGHNNKFQKNPSGSDRFSEEDHSRPNETPMSQRNQNLLNKHEESFDSPNSDFLENVKHGSIQSRRDIYSNDQGVSHMTSKMNESPGKDRPHLARDHVSLTFPEGRKFEKNTQLEPVSKPQAVAELGSLALPPVTNKLEVKQSEGGRFVNQQSSKYSSSLQYSYPKENSENSANRESKPQRGSPYTSEVSNLQKESPNLQKESPRVVITNRAIQASATQPEPVMYSDWTSIHGVAGIPDYNPAQAVGFFSSKNRNIHNKASTNNLEKQIASSNSRSSHSRVTINSSEKQTASIRDNRMRSERQIAGPKDQLDRDVYGFSSGSKQEHQSPGQEILQRKRFNPNDELLSPTQITKMNRHNSNKATNLRGTDLSLVKHGYKSKENSDKLVLHRGHKDNTVNRVTAAASKNGIRAMKHRNRERRRDRKSRSSPKPRTLKKTNAFSQRADPYSFRHRSTNRQQPHDPLMLRYEGMAQKEATFGPVAPKRHSLKPSRFKNDESYSKGITDSRYRDYSRRTSSLQEKRRSDNLIDTSRYAVLKVDEPFVNSAVTQASLHGANEVSIVPKQRSTGRELVTKVPKEIMQDQYNIRVTKNSKEPVYPVSASNQRPVMHSADGRMSRFTQRPVILSQATHQSGSHLPEAQSYARASKAEKPAQHQALRVSRNQLDDPLYRRNIQEPPNYYTRPPPSGFSHVTRAQSPSNIENRARSQPSGRASSRSSDRSSSKFSDTASRRAKQESYPVTLNYNLHGLSGPKRSERTYALHKPNHKNLNRIHLPVETKDISQYSLYGLRENSKTSVREGLLEPVALKDSRYKLRGANDRAMKSEDLTPRTSPIEKYKISRGRCSRKRCKLPYCRCVGPDIPGDLRVDEIPQMVMLTFDDGISIQNINYYRQLFNGSLRNPNGCPIKGTFFVSGDNTDYKLVAEVHRSGHEVASHTISHRMPTTWWAYAGYDNWNNEIVGMRERLHKKAGIPVEEITGMRAPFLQVGGDAQYAMLAENNFRYDTSMVTGDLHSNRKHPIWPFTLDTAPNGQTCSLTPCPKRSYPGLWEVPLVRWYGSNNVACAMPDACTIGSGTKGSLRFMKENFKRHYKRNKAPLGIFIHASWFGRQQGTLEGLAQFLDLISHMGDVWVVSVSQALDWVQNPVPMAKLDTLKSWGC